MIVICIKKLIMIIRSGRKIIRFNEEELLLMECDEKII